MKKLPETSSEDEQENLVFEERQDLGSPVLEHVLD